jgi:uncharacterized protein YjbI with pentapeptide repeats
MADQSHLNILAQGRKAWNSWRVQNPHIEKPDLFKAKLSSVDLSEANLSGSNLSRATLSEANLSEANLSEANLSEADLSRANLWEANLSGAKLSGVDLIEADLFLAHLEKADLRWADVSWANLSEANLRLADLSEANLSEANLRQAEVSQADLSKSRLIAATLYKAKLSEANLSGANLSRAYLHQADLSDVDLTRSALVKTNLTGATLTGCSIYGISAWNLNLEGAKQQNLNISDSGEPAIMVDNLEVAQFIYLLLNNAKIRDVIDTIGDKGVLILGRFTEERKAVLEAIRDSLREFGFVPMMFDFERPTQRDFSETIKTLAGLSRFIIADITNPKSSPLELQATMPNYMIPFVPIIQEDEEPFAMFRDLQQKYGEWVLEVLEYDSADNLIGVLDKAVVRPALHKSDQLLLKKAEAIRTRHIRDYQ